MAKRDGRDRRAERRRLSAVRDSSISNPYNEEVRWEVLLLELVNDWFLALCKNDPRTADKVEEALDELAACGPQLGRPLVDRIHNSKLHNLKELRPRVPGTAEVRLLFVFDPDREAIVLAAGDKEGRWVAGMPKRSRSPRNGTTLTGGKSPRRKSEGGSVGGHQAPGP